MTLSAISSQISLLRTGGRKIVLCHGVFDLLHPGHLDHLREAKLFGDVLIVSVTADMFVDKGPGRPIYGVENRVKMLAALNFVDLAFESPFPTAEEVIALVAPAAYVKGPDYKTLDADITGNILLEKAAVERAGGLIYFTTAPAMSSSKIINHLAVIHSEETENWLQTIRPGISEASINSLFARLEGLNVLVVGEMILDEYIFCEALGKTSKDPVLAFLKNSTERQSGGALAIAKHCAGLGATTTLLTRLGSDAEATFLDSEIRSSSIRFVPQVSYSQKTIVKSRYIDQSSGTKVFESYSMSDEAVALADDDAVLELLDQELPNADVVLIADYGHGLLSDRVVTRLADSKNLLAVNTQSNAGNRGFNPISRYPRIDIVSLNGSEIALELRKRHTSVAELLPILGKQSGADKIVVTEGALGLSIWSKSCGVQQMPAFTQTVRDRVGAGDALFAAVSLLIAVEAPAVLVGLFGNLAGAAMISDIGNRATLSAASLRRHAAALLA